MRYPREWERIDDRSERLKVPGGWIVRSDSGSYEGGVHQIFIEDINHEWRLEGYWRTVSNCKGY